MKVSVIIPVLNEAQNLLHMCSHLQAIKRQGHEVIIVDGGSVDNTLVVAHDITNLVIISKAGRALQMNSGADIASGKVLLFLHADTILPDNAMRLITALYTNKGTHKQDCWGRFDVRLSSTRSVFRLIEKLMNLRSCLTSIVTGDQAIFIEKELFERVGAFPEIALMEDIEISKRLKKISRPVCVKDKVITSSRRWENRGVVATVMLMWKLRLYYFFGVPPEKLTKLYR